MGKDPLCILCAPRVSEGCLLVQAMEYCHIRRNWHDSLGRMGQKERYAWCEDIENIESWTPWPLSLEGKNSIYIYIYQYNIYIYTVEFLCRWLGWTSLNIRHWNSFAIQQCQMGPLPPVMTTSMEKTDFGGFFPFGSSDTPKYHIYVGHTSLLYPYSCWLYHVISPLSPHSPPIFRHSRVATQVSFNALHGQGW